MIIATVIENVPDRGRGDSLFEGRELHPAEVIVDGLIDVYELAVGEGHAPGSRHRLGDGRQGVHGVWRRLAHTLPVSPAERFLTDDPAVTGYRDADGRDARFLDDVEDLGLERREFIDSEESHRADDRRQDKNNSELVHKGFVSFNTSWAIRNLVVVTRLFIVHEISDFELKAPAKKVPVIEEPDKNQGRHKNQGVMKTLATSPISFPPGFEHIEQNSHPKQGRDQW